MPLFLGFAVFIQQAIFAIFVTACRIQGRFCIICNTRLLYRSMASGMFVSMVTVMAISAMAVAFFLIFIGNSRIDGNRLPITAIFGID